MDGIGDGAEVDEKGGRWLSPLQTVMEIYISCTVNNFVKS